MQDLKLKTTLPALSFDYASLKSWALSMTEKYTGLVVTEDAIIDAKKDMAELNKAKKAVDDARKEAVRRVSEPIRDFENKIKEICGIFDTSYAALGEQVKRFEDAQREAKRKDIAALIIEGNQNAFGEPDFLDIPVQDKWLNKTTSLKAIREDIVAIIERHMEDEARKSALEQARQDRAAAIENHVVSLNKLRSLNLPLSRFLGGNALALDMPLSKVLLDIEERFKIEVDLRKAEENAKASLAAVPAKQSPISVEQTGSKIEQKPAPNATAQTRAMSIVLEYDLANETQVNTCLENLKTLCVNFGVRQR